MASFLWQSAFISAPTFTEATLPDQSGRVHIITGGYAGVGFHLAKYVLSRNATVYIAGRSEAKYTAALDRWATELSVLSSSLRVHFLHLDLADLSSVLDAADEFLSREQRLDVLTNNAGVVSHPDARTTQGYELQLGTNVLGPYLFTSRLFPLLQRTAALPDSAPGSVRITWAGSIAVDLAALLPAHYGALDAEGAALKGYAGDHLVGGTGADPANPGVHVQASQNTPAASSASEPVPIPVRLALQATVNYARSKVGNVYLAEAFSQMQQLPDKNTSEHIATPHVVSVAWNPGNLRTDLTRPASLSFIHRMAFKGLLYPPQLGGYTELFAGWSPQVSEVFGKNLRSETGLRSVYVAPWGRLHDLPIGVKDSMLKEKRHDRLLHWCRTACEPVIRDWEVTRAAGGVHNHQ